LPGRRVARVLTTLIAVPVIAYLAVLAYLYFNQRQLLYLPDRSRPPLGELSQIGVREVQLTTEDGLDLLSWYLPPQEGRPVIAYFHGNGGSIFHRGDRLRRFAREGYGVLMLGYRGYGGNPGAPSEAGLFTDARAALDFLRREGITAGRVVLYGESLGTAIAVYAATQQPVGAIVLESPFTSVAELAQYHYPFVPAALLVADRFDSASRIGTVKAPVLVLQGGHDEVVPARFGETLLAAANEPKERWFVPQAGHEDLAGYGALDAVVTFIERHLH
jgi:fermentation-respiration switch protein FrsA (DUF1100 family)